MSAQKVLELKRSSRSTICSLIDKYDLMNHQLYWRREFLGELRELLDDVLDLTDKQKAGISTADELRALVVERLGRMKPTEVNDVCFVLTFNEEE